jgi:hypothetical protein
VTELAEVEGLGALHLCKLCHMDHMGPLPLNSVDPRQARARYPFEASSCPSTLAESAT